jgi:hypothetical protein
MNFVVVVLLIEAGPICHLIGVVFPHPPVALGRPPLRRRSRFWLRFAGVFIALFFPLLVGVVARLGEQFVLLLLLSGLPWGILVALLSRFVLFDGPGFDPGSAGGDDEGPGPGGGRPTPPAPIGGIPLPDAEPSPMRLRDHRPPWRGARRRRPVRQRERLMSRLRRLVGLPADAAGGAW